MAIDPPYRFDPWQNLVNVNWGGGRDWYISFYFGTNASAQESGTPSVLAALLAGYNAGPSGLTCWAFYDNSPTVPPAFAAGQSSFLLSGEFTGAPTMTQTITPPAGKVTHVVGGSTSGMAITLDYIFAGTFENPGDLPGGSYTFDFTGLGFVIGPDNSLNLVGRDALATTYLLETHPPPSGIFGWGGVFGPIGPFPF